MEVVEEEKEDQLFVIDVDCSNEKEESVKPSYHVDHHMVVDEGEVMDDEDKHNKSTGEVCWNCDKSGHGLRDCLLPIDRVKVAARRKSFQARPSANSKRYHDDKFSRFKPGTISKRLREALGLRRCEVPMHIYMMRVHGYPPGWLAESIILPSGMQMYNSIGRRIPEPDEEEGEIIRKMMKYDVEKIVDYPGFNVPLHEGARDEHKKHKMPAMTKEQSKENYIKFLEELSALETEAAEKIYNDHSADMDVEEEVVTPVKKHRKRNRVVIESDGGMLIRVLNTTEESASTGVENAKDSSEVNKDSSTADAKTEGKKQDEEKTDDNQNSGGEGPKEEGEAEETASVSEGAQSEDTKGQPQGETDAAPAAEGSAADAESAPEAPVSEGAPSDAPVEEGPASPDAPHEEGELSSDAAEAPSEGKTQPSEPSTPQPSTPTPASPPLHHFGTPNIKSHSPFAKLPSFDSFSKDISEVIDFENLPNSVGKYSSLCVVIDKVRQQMVAARSARKSNLSS